jgi:Carboxypeptidase regulatory-like domain
MRFAVSIGSFAQGQEQTRAPFAKKAGNHAKRDPNQSKQRSYIPGNMTPFVRIASPCSADWSRMAGNERVRHCPDCKLNVYNFSTMSTAEVERIVSRTEGRLCARFYQRPDGTMLTKNCPVGFRAVLWRATRVASATLAALMIVRPAIGQSTKDAPQPLAQIENARRGLTLQVVDHPTGAGIASAPVKIVNEVTGAETLVNADDQGKVDLPDLPSGPYRVSVQVPGFVTATQQHVSVPTQQTIKIDVLLAPTMGEVIVVAHRNVVSRFFHKVREII